MKIDRYHLPLPPTEPENIPELPRSADWIRITKAKGFILDGKLSIRQEDAEAAAIDPTLKPWERKLFKAISEGDYEEGSIVVL